MQRGSEPDCVFFQRMVNGGERILDRKSRQGLWVCAPNGTVLARVNSRSAEKVLAALATGLEAWGALDDEARRVPDGVELEPAHRWEHNYPEGGLVLERIARDLDPGGLEAEPAERWNRDFAWLSQDEVRSLVEGDVEVGSTLELSLLARRLARFHLVDNVRGQTIPYADEELREARLGARVTARDGSVVTLALEGVTRAEAEGPWLLGDNSWKPFREFPHRIETRLVGEARLDLAHARFVEFDLVAVGRYAGRTAHNARRGDDPEGLVAFHLGLADPERRVAPTFLSLYGVDWVDTPDVPTWRAHPAECGLEEG